MTGQHSIETEADLAEAAGVAAGPSPEPAALSAEEAAMLKDQHLRTLADMENLRRRTARDVEDARKYAVTGFARGLLDVADNLARALASVPPEQRAGSPFMTGLVSGIEMTERSLIGLLERYEIRKVEPRPGDRFDPALHQAVFELPTATLAPGSIAEVMQPGYVIADRLLRPAMVGVAKAVPGPAGTVEADVGRQVDQLA